MTPLRALVVDDEPLARQRLARALPQWDVRIVGEADDGQRALELLRDLAPDVIFLDIKMPSMDGLDVLGALDRDRPPAVVFVTAYARFAPRAFEAHADDFLLKPFSPERLGAAVTHARAVLAAKSASERVAELEAVLRELREEDADAERPRFGAEVWASSREGSARLSVADIDWIEAERDYVRICCGGRTYMRREALHRLESKLDPDVFVRIHRSTIVRIAAITQIKRGLSRSVRVELAGGKVFDVSRSCAPAIRALARSRRDQAGRDRPTG